MLGSAFRRRQKHARGSGGWALANAVRSLLTCLWLAGPLDPRASAAESVALEFPQGAAAQLGQPFEVWIVFPDLGGGIIGFRLRLTHPESLLLAQKEVGELVPLDVRPIWTEEPGMLRLSAIRFQLWPKTSGVAARLVFIPQPGFNHRPTWELLLDEVEVTSNGEEIRPVPSFAAELSSGGVGVQPPQLAILPPSAGRGPVLLVAFRAGAEVVVEESFDLAGWREVARLATLGWELPVEFPLEPPASQPARFFRLRATE